MPGYRGFGFGGGGAGLPVSGGILTGALEISANGAASTAPLLLSGTILTGGSATTNFPANLIQPTGTTAVTSWSTSGTGLGMNLASGFAGNFLDFHVAGAASVFKVSSTGNITAPSANFSTQIVMAASSVLQIGSGGDLQLSGGGTHITSPSNAVVQFGAADVDTSASITAQTIRSQGTLAGGTSDQAGKDLTIIPSPGKGTGAGGKLIVQTALAGSTGTAVNTPTNSLVVNGQTTTVCANTATPAAGAAAAVLLFGTTSGFGIYYGSGAPTVSAAQGSIYLRSDGSSTSTRLYVNTNGSTTWTNVTTAA